MAIFMPRVVISIDCNGALAATASLITSHGTPINLRSGVMASLAFSSSSHFPESALRIVSASASSGVPLPNVFPMDPVRARALYPAAEEGEGTAGGAAGEGEGTAGGAAGEGEGASADAAVVTAGGGEDGESAGAGTGTTDL